MFALQASTAKATPGRGFLRHGGLALFALALFSGVPAGATLIVTPTFSPSVQASFGDNTGAMEAAWIYAAAQFSLQFDDDIHINLDVNGTSGTSTVASSSMFVVGASYSTIRTHAALDALSADDILALGPLGSVAASDPVPGDHLWALTSAQAKAMGIIPDDLLSDGSTTFSAGYSYTFDPNNRTVPGAIDFIGVAEHEISVIMGRVYGLGATMGGNPGYLYYDLFRFTAEGSRDLTGTGGSYFSLDDGATQLMSFNSTRGNGTSPQDWANSSGDAFNAFANNSVLNGLSDTDIRVMDVLGYNRTVTPETPEPSTLVLLGCGLLAVCVRRRVTAAA
jgi:hypothetical protein